MEAAPGHKFSLTPYFSIIIGVTLSVLLCLLLSFVKRGMRNRRLRCARLCELRHPALAGALSHQSHTIIPRHQVLCLSEADMVHSSGRGAERGALPLQAVQGGRGADGAPAAPGPRREHGAHRVPTHARVQGVGGSGAAAGGRPRPGGAQVCTGARAPLGSGGTELDSPCPRTSARSALCFRWATAGEHAGLWWEQFFMWPPVRDAHNLLPTLQRAAGRGAAGAAGNRGGGQRVHGVPGGVPGRGGAAHAALRPLLPRRQVHRPLAAVALVLPHVRAHTCAPGMPEACT